MSVALKRAAGQKRAEAREKFGQLEAVIERQLKGELQEGESRLSATDIAERRKAIDDLINEAKEIEGMTTLSGIMGRPDVSNGARDMLPDTRSGGGDDDEPKAEKVFESLGEYLRAVRSSSGSFDANIKLTDRQRAVLSALGTAATRLEQGEPVSAKEFGPAELKTLVGDDVGSAGRADYLVPREYMSELLRIMGESQQFANRARRVPMTRRTIVFPRLVQDATDVNRPIFGFAAVTKIAEAATKPEREPRFDQLTLTAVKYAAYLEASDELLADSIVDLPPVLIDLLTSAIAYEFDRDTIRGTGVGEPQGFLGSAASLVVPRTASEDVTYADILNMEARFFGTNGIYLFHQSAIPKIYGLQQNNLLAWNKDLTAAVPGTLLGRPMVRTSKLPPVGFEGDFNLVDPSFYLVGELQNITVANSIHYRFRNDVTAWRAVYRATGTPWPAGTFSHEASGGALTWEVSPFVVLGDTTAS